MADETRRLLRSSAARHGTRRKKAKRVAEPLRMGAGAGEAREDEDEDEGGQRSEERPTWNVTKWSLALAMMAPVAQGASAAGGARFPLSRRAAQRERKREKEKAQEREKERLTLTGETSVCLSSTVVSAPTLPLRLCVPRQPPRKSATVVLEADAGGSGSRRRREPASRQSGSVRLEQLLFASRFRFCFPTFL